MSNNSQIVVDKDVKHSLEIEKLAKGYSSLNIVVKNILLAVGLFELHPDNQVLEFKQAKQLRDKKGVE